MADKVEIVIKDMRTPKWLRALVVFGFLVFFPIGLGIYANSSAMQWAGFFFGVLCAFALAKKDGDEITFKSVEAARAHLDALQNKEHSNG